MLIRRTALPTSFCLLLTLLIALASPATLRAQTTERATRAAQWDAYTPPAGAWKRTLDQTKGYAIWLPPDWKDTNEKDGRVFMPPQGGTNVFIVTEDIPEGFGIANYANATLQGLRGQRLRPDSMVVRTVWLNGLEWRELSYEIEVQAGVYIHQTMWLTVHGARAYGFACAFQPADQASHEPVFKRALQSVRILAAGPWEQSFESLRERFAAQATATSAANELAAAQLADAVRGGREPQTALLPRLQTLFAQAPAEALDLLTDAAPLVRSYAITALGQHLAQSAAPANNNSDTPNFAALFWALKDKDNLASTCAAQALAGLTATTPQWLANWQPQLNSLSETPVALVRLGAALSEANARALAEELLRSDNAKQQLAALQMALSQPRLKLALPYARLFAANDAHVLHALVALIQRQQPADATGELTKLLRAETEAWAARALGDIAPPEFAARLDARIAEIDKRLGTVVATPKKPAKKRRGIEVVASAGVSINPTLGPPSELKTKPEETRLALTRGELVNAAAKIKLRQRWQQAKDEAARRALLTETEKEDFTLADWARAVLMPDETASASAAAANVAFDVNKLDVNKLKDVRSTGATLFPANTLSYVQAPNLATALEKLDQALAGVQMATVRDQMTLAFFLNVFKANLAAKYGTVETPDLSVALGVDLQAPVAVGAWRSADAPAAAPMRSGLTLRVTDRARFERLLAGYQEDFGSLDSLAVGAPLLARAAGLLPAIVPAVFGMLASPENLPTGILPATRRSGPFVPADAPAYSYVSQERWGELSVTIFAKHRLSTLDTLTAEALYVAYLGQTALVASSRAALLEALQTAATPAQALAQSPAFTQLQRERGELIFFSQPRLLLSQLAAEIETPETTSDEISALLSVLGTESGALQISPSTWETVFNLTLADNQFSRTFKPFNVAALAAPRELLPQGTILYAGAVIDPPALWTALKKLEKADKPKPPDKAKQEAAKTPQELAQERALDEDMEKLVVPNLHGELAAALVSFKPLFDPQLNKGSNGWPALVFAAKLKGKELAALHQSGKLFAPYPRVPDTKIFGAPVIALGEDNGAPFLVVNDYYLILADSLATLRLLEGQDSFAKAQDFQRSQQAVPEQVAFFATYNLNAAFEEARSAMQASKQDQMLPFVSAVTHAFHSQRAFVTLTPEGLQGRLAVAFDREGRYAVGNLARPSGEFDVANALIVPKGLRVLHSPRIESLTVRATAKQPGIVPRVRDDLSKFAWQKIADNNEHALSFTSTARRIAPTQTVKLPVTGAEFSRFLDEGRGIFPQAPEIVARAKEIVGKDSDGRSVAQKLAAWTYANLKWKRVQSNTLETLASREADCLEHAELYVALARASGLPARVVTGAALGDGSFGAHAWVEVYLGQWCELDPTWGLLDYVDATHLRFENDSFAQYAMLNQLELEITGARTAIADYQRDPLQLIKAIGKHKDLSAVAFDLGVTAETAFGPGGWEKLTDQQRNAAIQAFETTVNQLTVVDEEEEETAATSDNGLRVLRSEVQGQRATVLALQGDQLQRYSLFARDGAWFISEIENVDATLPLLADALRGAWQPQLRRQALENLETATALKRLEALIAQQGELPELLLQKAQILDGQEVQQYLVQRQKQENTDEKANEKPAAAAYPTAATELFRQVAQRWPNYAAAQWALGQQLKPWFERDQAKRQTQLQEALAPLQRYAQLAPYDPRPWLELAEAYTELERLPEAEAAYRAAIEREPNYLEHRNTLFLFHLTNQQPEKARATLGEMFKVARPETVFATLRENDDLAYDFGAEVETLLQAFPKELSASKTGLQLLAEAQEAQEKYAAASKTMARVLTLEPDTYDYSYQALLLRKQRRFAEAVTAATQSLKLAKPENSTGLAYFTRACARAQLGAKKLAIADLQKLLETEQVAFFDLEEADLEPLAALPEFKALAEKVKQARQAADTEETQPPKPEKP